MIKRRGVFGKNKGQFFIMAAVILSVLLFGLAFTVNEVVANEEDFGFYDYAEGVEREVNNVLDYQVYSDIPFDDLDNFIYMLEEDFKDRGEKGNFVFLYGNLSGMKIKNVGTDGIKVEGGADVVLNGAGDSEDSKIRVGGIGFTVNQININNTEAVLEDLNVGDVLKIYFNEQAYDFPVSEVNQVIFIIQKDKGEETYVEVR